MGARPRSTRSSPIKKSASPGQATTNMLQSSQSPLRILIASKTVSPTARLLLLKHPQNGYSQRFLLCPENGLFEVTKRPSSATTPKCILFSKPETNESCNRMDEHTPVVSEGSVSTDTDILTATPFDLAFLLLRYLAPESTSSKRPMFQPTDDIFEIPTSEEKHLRYLFSKSKDLVEQAMTKICDCMDAGDERMFRYNEDKVFSFWVQKAEHVAKQGLPSSMEDRFVTRALEAPVSSINREDSQSTVLIDDGSRINSPEDNHDSESSTGTSGASVVFSHVSSASTAGSSTENIISADVPGVDIYGLQRLMVALKFISATCLPTSLANRLQRRLEHQTSPIDFTPLHLELNRISDLRVQAQAQRSVTDFSRKRAHIGDEEAAELKAEKKRKLEEDEKKRRANESRGVRDLKKVNVSGMKKMSDFFAKKPMAVKAKT